MEQSKYYRLVSRGEISAQDLESVVRDAGESSLPVEELLLRRGVPRHEVLFCLGEYYGVPFVEYDESVIVSQQITRRMDMERLKRALWLPLSITGDSAEVIACRPDDPAVLDDVRKTLGVSQIDFKVALPSDLVRIIEHNQDLNPGFPPPAAGRRLPRSAPFSRTGVRCLPPIGPRLRRAGRGLPSSAPASPSSRSRSSCSGSSALDI